MSAPARLPGGLAFWLLVLAFGAWTHGRGPRPRQEEWHEEQDAEGQSGAGEAARLSGPPSGAPPSSARTGGGHRPLPPAAEPGAAIRSPSPSSAAVSPAPAVVGGARWRIMDPDAFQPATPYWAAAIQKWVENGLPDGTQPLRCPHVGAAVADALRALEPAGGGLPSGGSVKRKLFLLEEETAYLNHGGYGATLRPAAKAQVSAFSTYVRFTCMSIQRLVHFFQIGRAHV